MSDRTITIGEYRFNEKKHLHELLKDGEYKPLTGVTTVLRVIGKGDVLVNWAANCAVGYIENNLFLSKSVREAVKATIEVTGMTIGDVLAEARTAHTKKKEKAGEQGTDTHAEVEKIINIAINDGGYLNPSYAGISTNKQITSFIHWAIENKVKFLAAEKHVYSKSMWVGGICDFICEIDGKRYVGDIKTGKGIYPEAYIQTSAYARMLEEMGEYQNEYIEDPDKHPLLWKVKKPAFDGVVILNLKKDGGFEVGYNFDVAGNFSCFKAALTIYRHLEAIKK